MFKINRSLLESLCEAAKNTYPDEFFCLLGGDKSKKEVDEFVIVPAIYGKGHAMYYPHMVPIDSRILGSAHSHPTSNFNPSSADLRTFSRFGELHLIIARPFNARDVYAFGKDGEAAEIRVFEG